MLSVSHTLISLPFAIVLDNPVIIFLAAAAWHVFCDTLLHWNIYPQQFRRYPWALVALDIAAGLLLAWALVGDHILSAPILAAIAGGNAPDIIHGLWDMIPAPTKKSLSRQGRGWPVAWFIFHERSQLETTNVAAGVISQITLIAVSLYVVLSF